MHPGDMPKGTLNDMPKKAGPSSKHKRGIHRVAPQDIGSVPKMILFDTNVVIDLTRGSELGRRFLKNLGDTQLRIPSVVAMEFLIGSRNR